jgi:hypothetical protein
MGTSQQAETRNGQYVSGNFFQTFGVGPWIGRVLTRRTIAKTPLRSQ